MVHSAFALSRWLSRGSALSSPLGICSVFYTHSSTHAWYCCGNLVEPVTLLRWPFYSIKKWLNYQSKSLSQCTWLQYRHGNKKHVVWVRRTTSRTLFLHHRWTTLTLLGPQYRFGNNLLRICVVWPQKRHCSSKWVKRRLLQHVSGTW